MVVMVVVVVAVVNFDSRNARELATTSLSLCYLLRVSPSPSLFVIIDRR